MTTDSVRAALHSLNRQKAINILNPTDDLEYFEISVEPMKLRLRLNQLDGSVRGIFTVGMVETKKDAEIFVPKFLKQFEGMPVGPFLISLSRDEVGCLIQNDFALQYRDVVRENQVLKDLEQQTILATTILLSLVHSKILLFPDDKALDRYKLNVGQEIYKNVLSSATLLKSV